MADTQNKVLNTRIKLKYDSYANWQAATDVVLLKGEVAICEIPGSTTTVKDENGKDKVVTTAPTVLFKVGTYDGADESTKKTFSQLPWASAKAADVHEWAKLPWDGDPDGNDFVTKYLYTYLNTEAWVDISNTSIMSYDQDGNPLYESPVTLTNALHYTAQAATEDIVEAASAVSTSMEGKVEFAELDVGLRTGAHGCDTLVLAHKTSGVTADTYGGNGGSATTPGATVEILVPQFEVNEYGHVTSAENKTYTVTTGVMSVTNGSANGTIKVDGTDLEVTGLDTAAYVTVESLNATAKGYADAVEAKLPTSANYGVLSITAGDDTITIGGNDQTPTIKVTEDKFDAHGAAEAVQTGIENGKIVAKNATNAVNATNAETAAKVANSLTVGNKTFDGSAAVTVTAADLGLANALHFVGTTRPQTPVAGDVVLEGNKEFVYDGSDWVELGDGDSHALKSVTIIGADGLTGGGTLEESRTIGIADKGVTNVKIADNAVETRTIADAAVTAGKLSADAKALFDEAGAADNALTEAQGYADDAAAQALADAKAYADQKEHKNTTYTAAPTTTALQFTLTPSEGEAQTVTLVAPEVDTGVMSVETGATEGTISVNGNDVAVNGLKDLAFKDSLTAAEVGAATSEDITAAINALDSKIETTAEVDNKVTVLTGLTQTDGVLANSEKVTLAAIAKTGKVQDLIQDAGTYIVFDCGSASTVI